MKTKINSSTYPAILFSFILVLLSFNSSHVFAADKVVVIPLNGKSTSTTLTVLDSFSCTSLSSVTTTYAKISDLGSFIQNGSSSTIEATFYGTILLSTSTGSGAQFELRIDDTASSIGRSRTPITTSDVGNIVHISISGIFTNLGAGSHTVSMWARVLSGTGTNAGVAPGCYNTDHVIVKEFE